MIEDKNFKIRFSYFGLLLIFLSFSCQKNHSNNSINSIRLVGIDGKTRPIETKTPALNRDLINKNSLNNQQNFNNFNNSNSFNSNSSAQAPAVIRNDQKNFNSPNIASRDDVNQNFSANRYNNPNNQNNNLSQSDLQTIQETFNSKEAKPLYKNSQGEVITENQVIEDGRMINIDKNLVKNSSEQNSQNNKDSFEIDLSQDEVNSDKNSKSEKEVKMILQSGASAKNIEINDDNLKGFFIQAGSFSELENAEKIMKKTTKFFKTTISESNINNKKIYRVLVGPFVNSKKANLTLKKIKKAGIDAILVNRK
jgi:cell division septation protein DedD